MDVIAIGQGTLLEILAPLLLIPTVWIVYRYLLRPWVLPLIQPNANVRTRQRTGLALSVILVGTALWASFFPGRERLRQLCADLKPAVIISQVRAEGFFHDALHPFQARELLDGGEFAFIEAPDPYHSNVYLRFTRSAGGGIQETTIAKPASRYWVQVQQQELGYDLQRTDKRVFTYPDSELLATASVIRFGGGPLSWLLGGYGRRQCPDPADPEGRRALRTFERLEVLVLGGAELTQALSAASRARYWFHYEH